MAADKSSVNLKVRLMQISSELRIFTDENLNLKQRLSTLWGEKQALEQALKERDTELQQLKSSYELVEGLPKAEQVLSQREEMISLQQASKEQTYFLEKLSSALTRLLVSTYSMQSLPETVKQTINEIEGLLWTEGLPEQKMLVALIRHGGQLPPSELQAKCALSSKEFERALHSLRISGALTDTGTNLVELTTMKPATIPSSQWGKLKIPEIFQEVHAVVVTEKDVDSITNALKDLRDALFLKGVSPRLVYQIEAEAREWRSGSVTKEELLNALSEWEAQALS